MQILNKLKQLDAYPKVNEDFYSRTLSGGLITVISSVFMALLFITELRMYASFHTLDSLAPPPFLQPPFVLEAWSFSVFFNEVG